ncbi:MAG: sulfur oxidation c-type cytochrome SoxX [Usitatibacteraceae bacterium]
MVRSSAGLRADPAMRILGFLLFSMVSFAQHANAQVSPQHGRALFVSERKGNCIACHRTPGDSAAKGVANIGMPLESIKQKYPAPADRARLRSAIWDMGKLKPDTIMPPYGKHHILTETEIDAIVAYLETL